jgi:DinB superfamily
VAKPTAEEIDTYEAAPSRIATAIEGLSEAQLQYRSAPDEWSIHEVVVHLADAESVGYWRLRKTLAEKDALLAVYDEEAWAKNLDYSAQSLELALNLFTALRASSTALLRLLPDAAWERTSMHAERGELNVYALFTTYLEHGSIHLEQIERIKHIDTL